MDIKLNVLPSKTWNRLGMNETFVSVENLAEDFSPAIEEHIDITVTRDYDFEENLLKGGLYNFFAPAKVTYIESKEGGKENNPVLVKWDYSDGQKARSRVVLHAKQNSILSAIFVLNSNDLKGTDSLSAISTELFADDNSQINLYVANLLNSNAVCINDIRGICGKDAKINLIKLELGSEELYANTEINLDGERSDFTTDLGYYVKTDHIYDMNYVVNHRGVHTNCLMEISGTLEENSKKVFRGTIDFKRGCKASVGTESESVLLLGDEMINQTLPVILCEEEDVEGNHGASIGKLDDKVLFYLGARGFSPEEAQKMVTRSRIDSVCQKIPSEEIQAQINDFISERM